MGINAILAPSDLVGREIPAGWYPAEITKYEEAVTKGTEAKPSDGSTNAIFYFTILDGPAKGREIRRYFNEKFMGMGKNLWPLIIPGFVAGKGGVPVNTENMSASVGKKLKIYVKKGTNGFDSVEDFQPLA